ncbi:MAG TPA: endo-1,4-beta-xylanase [bacterium]|nr:endo-1,4-beta-xylanase [bacterium]HPR89024.1 endo-1,4-beta-xylanase [bacterium]
MYKSSHPQRPSPCVVAFLILFFLLLAGAGVRPLGAQPLAQGLDRFLGGGTSADISRYLIKYWNQVTPGNDGKWGSVEFAQGTYYWTNLDKIYNYVTTRGLLYKHHTLVWGQQQPGWITSLDSAGQRQAVENWIKAVGQRYPKMNFIDVVNEPIRAPAAYKQALGGDGATGWDWVITAFELARKYCTPGVKLLLNEYNILQDNAMTDSYIALINLLRQRGLIDGIGIQGHYFEFRSDTRSANQYAYSLTTLKGNLDRIAALGLPIYITEFDVDEPDDAVQLEQYKIYFKLLWNQPAVKGITFWGYIEGDVWTSHPYTYLLKANGSERAVVPWLRNYVLMPLPPLALSPNGSNAEVRNPRLVWNTAPLATAYRLQLTTARAFNTTLLDTTLADTSLQLGKLDANGRYYWRVSARNDKGESDFSAVAFFTTGTTSGVIDPAESAPADFTLEQNYPNPFNPVTTVAFRLAADAKVDLCIFDLLGREVATLFHGRLAAGTHQLHFDGSALESGSYLYTLKSDHFRVTRRMTLIK